MTKLLPALVFAAGMAAASSANAAVALWTTSGPTTTYGTATTIIDFDSTNGSFSGDFGIFNGLQPNVAAPPFNDSTKYGSVGSSVGSPAGVATLTLSSAVTYLGLYWGSIDSYNTISFYDANHNLVGSKNGIDVLNPANGNQGAGGSSFANFSFDTGVKYVEFTSGTGNPVNVQAAFEFDNIATAVPEPTTWAMMILGFLGLGFLGYRKSSKAGDASFRLA